MEQDRFKQAGVLLKRLLSPKDGAPPGARGLPAVRRLHRWLRPKDGLILMYHRVSEEGPDPWGLSVSPRHFAEHLEVLRARALPMTVRQLASDAAPRRGRGAVAITFDDGYADNLLAAAPLLRRLDMPATLFVATGLVGTSRAFWWDELADLLLRPGRRPPTLRLTIAGREHHWSLGASADYSAELYRKYRAWPVTWEEPPTERQAVYAALYDLLRPLPPGEQRQALGSLAEWAGKAPSSPTHRMLTQGELASLAATGRVEIGAHSVTHPVLPNLPLDLQRSEVSDSKAFLEHTVGTAVTSFAYPHGETSAETIEILRQAGFERACTTRPGFVEPETPPWELPRVEVRDSNGRQLAAQLDHLYASARHRVWPSFARRPPRPRAPG